jgi:hypothetical protein
MRAVAGAVLCCAGAGSALAGPVGIAEDAHRIALKKCLKHYSVDYFKRTPVFIRRDGGTWVVRFGSGSDEIASAFEATVDARTGAAYPCTLHALHWSEPSADELERAFGPEKVPAGP